MEANEKKTRLNAAAMSCKHSAAAAINVSMVATVYSVLYRRNKSKKSPAMNTFFSAELKKKNKLRTAFFLDSLSTLAGALLNTVVRSG